jgi:hypothetical protein
MVLGLHFVAALLAGAAARRAGAVIGFLDFTTWLGHDKTPEAETEMETAGRNLMRSDRPVNRDP